MTRKQVLQRIAHPGERPIGQSYNPAVVMGIVSVAKVVAFHIKASKIVAREIVPGIWEAIVPHLGNDHVRIPARTQMYILVL